VRNEPLSTDEVTVHLVATGLIKLVRDGGQGQSLCLPYVPDLQRGLNRLAVAALRRGVAPPQGIADLISWCKRPISEWPLDLPEDVVEGGARLLDEDLPTGFCDAWACATDDAEAEVTEQHVMLGALSVCQSARAPESYVAFRRLLIDRPVLTAFELQQCLIDPQVERLGDQIRAAYAAAPAAARADGLYYACAHCRNLLLRTVKGDLVCEDAGCRRTRRVVETGRSIDAREGVSWLIRGLRHFVAAPGRAELRLAERLRRLGVEVTLWPAYDRYDLRLLFPDGEAWAIDVKDWADPVVLARRLNERGSPPIPPEPSWTRAYFIFPDERRTERPDYVRAFVNRATVLGNEVRAGFAADLVKDARIKLVKGGPRDA
jgi:pPIWI_RE three-gene island domain Y/REase associating with pPIWI_RE